MNDKAEKTIVESAVIEGAPDDRYPNSPVSRPLTTGDIVEVSPMAIISAAVERGTDVTVLEKMFDLYERDQARLAAKEFDKAMAAFQGSVRPIRRSKKADRFTYAPIEEIIRTIQPDLTANGLSVRFDTKFESDGYITAYCTVSHVGGHKERSEFTCPVDKENKQKINVAQQQASANSYARRYALSNALNIVYTDEDDDGTAAGTAYITDEKAANIEALLSEVGANKGLFLKWCRAESVEVIPANKYTFCIKRLEEMRAGTDQ